MGFVQKSEDFQIQIDGHRAGLNIVWGQFLQVSLSAETLLSYFPFGIFVAKVQLDLISIIDKV